MRFHLFKFILNLLAIRAISIQKFHTYELKNQHDISIEWENYSHILICTKETKDLAKEWGKKLLNKGIKDDSICVITPLPKWMTKSPGAKKMIKTTIAHIEKEIPIFIDWGEKIININKICEYPTIILLSKNNQNDLYELGRVCGKYSDEKYNSLKKMSRSYSHKFFRF
tara:strand:+ start:2998 stop:3504 length:507 start_codon:yes stop_codon:yes gene_type:complete